MELHTFRGTRWNTYPYRMKGGKYNHSAVIESSTAMNRKRVRTLSIYKQKIYILIYYVSYTN